MRKTLLTFTALILSAPLAMAQMSGSTGMDHAAMAMSKTSVDGAVHAEATVNRLDADTVNVSHGPIPEIGWPAMTMDMPLAEDANVMADLAAGDQVIMMLVKDAHGMYVIKSLAAR
ncbi:copper-binding protein [Roseovarius autotrophicus]|uniref:copper-binding protein n=1 Tax=Roseovarius autotrophicus TaxID=2824121 RepID=UPI001A01C447|nr:copper-binding protein [Roseovarius autotrophicus]MBE0453004.1 copper-binding protein [Roseovarius sp.]